MNLAFRILFIKLLIISNVFIGFSQKLEYELFGEGIFQIVGDNDTRIERKKHKQIEVFNNGKTIIVYRYWWISENEYKMKVKKIINFSDKDICMKKKDVIIVSLSRITDTVFAYGVLSERCGLVSGAVAFPFFRQ